MDIMKKISNKSAIQIIYLLLEKTKKELLLKCPLSSEITFTCFKYILGRRLNKEMKNIVIFNHFYDQDIAMLKCAADSIKGVNLVVLNPRELANYIKSCLPESVYRLDGYYKPEHRCIQAAIQDNLVELLVRIKKVYPDIVFCSPSDQFFWIREFVCACRRVGVRFVVVDKEGTISPITYELHAQELKKHMPFISDAVIVWSERQCKFFKKIGATENQIFIEGQPRSDYWKRPTRWNSREKVLSAINMCPSNATVLYFDFDKHYYLHESQIKKGINWAILLNDVHDVLIRLARENPKINVIFKIHPQAPNSAEVTNKINGMRMNNVKAVGGASISNDLITVADLVVGFHSTAILEAMLTDLPIVYTYWGGATEISGDLIPFHENKGIDVVTSKEEFEEVIAKYTNRDTIGQRIGLREKREREALTDLFFFNPDGNVSARVLHRILEISDHR